MNITHPDERKVIFDNHLSEDEAAEASRQWTLPQGQEVVFAEIKTFSTGRAQMTIWYAPKKEEEKKDEV